MIWIIVAGIAIAIIAVAVWFIWRRRRTAAQIEERLASYTEEAFDLLLEEAEGADLKMPPLESSLPKQPFPWQRQQAVDRDARWWRNYDLLMGLSQSDEPPQFSAFYPQLVQPNHAYALLVYAHLAEAKERLVSLAQQFQSMLGEQTASGTTTSTVHIPTDTLLTFVPQVPGVMFNPPEQVVVWRPAFQTATFLFQTPPDLQNGLTGRVLIYQGPLIVGEIPIVMEALPLIRRMTSQKAALTESDFERFEPIFASYSHKDTPIMEYFRQARQNIGQKMLVDIYDLRAGDHWQERILEMIDDSAVFQLFWSQHSAASDYCKVEWKHALRYESLRKRFIQPIWWEDPMPIPPQELAHLHFQRIQLEV